jgi:hypothetical protein
MQRVDLDFDRYARNAGICRLGADALLAMTDRAFLQK